MHNMVHILSHNYGGQLRSGNWIVTLRQQNFEISPFSHLSTMLPSSLPKLALCFYTEVLIFWILLPAGTRGGMVDIRWDTTRLLPSWRPTTLPQATREPTLLFTPVCEWGVVYMCGDGTGGCGWVCVCVCVRACAGACTGVHACVCARVCACVRRVSDCMMLIPMQGWYCRLLDICASQGGHECVCCAGQA